MKIFKPAMVLCLMLLVAFSCGRRGKEKAFTVAVTILPQQEFIERISDTTVDVVLMVPPGANPHVYEPTPRQMKKLARARLYFKVGAGVEFERKWMDKLAALNPGMKVIDCSRNIALLDMPAGYAESGEEAHAGLKDPHIWTSPQNVTTMVQTMAQALIRTDGPHKKIYQAGMEKYLREVSYTDFKLSRAAAQAPVKKFMVYHPAWSYLARDYGLEEIPVEIEGKEPTPYQIKAFIDNAKRWGIKVIFVSPEFSAKSAELIARELHGSTVAISDLEKDWTMNMLKIAAAIEKNGQ